MVDLNDEVELTKNRIGIVRYKGPLYGKNGMYYGIELTKGTGKHGGLFRGQRYFSCHRTKGIFVDKKQILFKFTNDSIPNSPKIKRKKSKSKTLSRTTSSDLGKGRFKLPRKTGPSHATKSSTKSDWKPPSFMQDVLDDIEYDYEFLGERLSHRGKFQPHTKYDKAGYLPHAKWKRPKWKAEDWTAFLAGINDETLRFEMEKQMIEWKEELNETQNYLSDSELEDITNKRILLEEEIKEMEYEKNKLQTEYDKKQEQQRMRELSEELLEQKLEEERLFLKNHKQLSNKQIEQKELHIEMENEELKLTKLEEKRIELENVRRELEKKEERLKIEKENSNKELQFEKEKLKKERQKIQRQKIEIEKLAKEKQFQNEQKIKILNNERKKLERQKRKQELENEQKWEERRIKIEQMKFQEKKDRQRRMHQINDSSDSDDRKREDTPMFKGGYSSSDCSSKTSNKSKGKKKIKKRRRRKKRRKKESKTPKKDYKIYFSVNIETNENCDDLISNIEPLKYLLSDLFETKSEQEVFEIKTRKKSNGFKIDFGIIIATSMHPADYIDTFDDLTMDGSFQEIIKEGFDLNNNLYVHVWEARYEKVDPKKQRKRKNYY